MTGLSMTSASGWLAGLGFGALYGVLFGAMITLAKGGASYGHALFISGRGPLPNLAEAIAGGTASTGPRTCDGCPGTCCGRRGG